MKWPLTTRIFVHSRNYCTIMTWGMKQFQGWRNAWQVPWGSGMKFDTIWHFSAHMDNSSLRGVSRFQVSRSVSILWRVPVLLHYTKWILSEHVCFYPTLLFEVPLYCRGFVSLSNRAFKAFDNVVSVSVEQRANELNFEVYLIPTSL